MRDNPGGESKSRRFNVVKRSRPSILEVGRNGKTTTPKGPTIRSPPKVWKLIIRVAWPSDR